jgi:glyoxylase-like metal-dependent hydrolase (beta-lactamase superfamily II)
MVSLPGHTRGHSGVLIEDGTKTLFTGDSFLLEAQLLKKPYAVAVNLYNQLTHDNPTQAEETLNKIRVIHTQYPDMLILSSHDPVLFRRSLKQEETEK